MCIVADSLGVNERSVLQAIATERLPGYASEARDNGQIIWVELAPSCQRGLPRFTICRVDPSIVVRVENNIGQQWFISTPTVEDALSYACRLVHEAALALRNVHPVPELMQ